MAESLNFISDIISYEDLPQNNNPSRRVTDWKREIRGVNVNETSSQKIILLPNETRSVFNGVVLTTIDGTTELDLTITSIDPTSRYRIDWTGNGTSPGFRTNRGLALSGGTVDVVLNANSTITVTSSLGAVFGSVIVGDIIFIPGVLTGDTGPFNELNVGEWIVVSATTTTLVLKRPSGSVFSGSSESGTIVTSDSELIAYSAAGVQVGDSVDIGGFAADGVFKVVLVTSERVDFVSSEPRANELAVIPGVNGMVFYSDYKQFLYIESSQKIAVRLNGNVNNDCLVEPFLNKTSPGILSKSGAVFSLNLVNLSNSNSECLVITAS